MAKPPSSKKLDTFAELAISVETLEPLVKEVQTISDRNLATKIMPERMITRPKTTSEHLITEADLAQIENSGDSSLHSWALLFIGGAISSFPSFLASAVAWNNATVTPTTLVDLVSMIIFPVCTVVGGFFYKFSPTVNGSLKHICAEIKNRDSVKPDNM
jgi:hypothetical protein